MKYSNMIIGNVYVALDKKAEAVRAIRESVSKTLRELKDKHPEWNLDWDIDLDEIDGFDDEEG